jgi:hypothetical protein
VSFVLNLLQVNIYLHALIANRSDEDPDNCHSECEFYCRDGSDCIAHSLVCDWDQDCVDGSDESNCNYHSPHNDCHPEFEFQVRQLKQTHSSQGKLVFR